LGFAHSYWAAVSAIVVMGFDTTLTFASCRDRIIGTAIGAFMGWVTYYAWHGHYLQTVHFRLQPKPSAPGSFSTVAW
jgi:uncharacterized membrane protein YccC